MLELGTLQCGSFDIYIFLNFSNFLRNRALGIHKAYDVLLLLGAQQALYITRRDRYHYIYHCNGMT